MVVSKECAPPVLSPPLRWHSSSTTAVMWDSETWMSTVKTDKKGNIFHWRCVRQISKLNWCDHITNKEMWRRTKAWNRCHQKRNRYEKGLSLHGVQCGTKTWSKSVVPGKDTGWPIVNNNVQSKAYILTFQIIVTILWIFLSECVTLW